MTTSAQLGDAAKLYSEKIHNLNNLDLYGGISADSVVLVVLAAGRGTRFGQDPKCIQPIHGTPLARHSIDAFWRFSPSPVICLVGYRAGEVMAALGHDNIYVESDNPTGGTAFAAFETFSVPELLTRNPLMMITYGDRIIPSSVFRRLYQTHRSGNGKLTLRFSRRNTSRPRIGARAA